MPVHGLSKHEFRTVGLVAFYPYHLYMRFFVLWIFLSSSVAMANDNQCIFGNPGRNKHAKAVAGFTVEPESFLATFLNHKNRKLCEPHYLHTRNLTNYLMSEGDLRFRISRDCIRESMMNIKDITAYRADCDNDMQGVSSRRKMVSGRKGDTCLTESMVDYVHFAVDEATKCVNAISEYPIDPMILFKKFNRESGFGYYLQSERGNGVGQLTSIAMKEMVMDKHDGKVYRDKALETPACRNFHNMLSKPVDFPKINRRDSAGNVIMGKDGKPLKTQVVRICQLVNSQDGLARNLFYSMALFSHNRDTHRNAIGKKMRKLGIFNETTINYMTLVSYGRNGLVHAEATLEQLVDEFGYEYLETISAERILKKIGDMTPKGQKSPTLENIRKHFGEEHNKVLTTDDILEYMEKNEPRVLNKLFQLPGVAAIIGLSHDEFLDKLKSMSPYVDEIEGSFDSFASRMTKNKGSAECFKPFSLQ